MPGLLDRLLASLNPPRSTAAAAAFLDQPAAPAPTVALKPLTDALAHGVLLVDAAGRIRAANPAAGRLLAADPADLTGQTLLEATHLQSIADLVAQPGGGEAEVRTVSGASGPPLTLRARVVPAGENAADGFWLILEDQTELTHLRTVRTEFVANVSHELRTPLASIRATAETLADGALNDPALAARFLDTILREADRLVHLSNDLLDLSRAERGELRSRARFDLAALARDVAARLAAPAERRGVALAVAAADPVFVFADAGEIEQVLFNLLDNALKYTPAGGRATLSICEHANDARIVVEDTGIGILSQDLPRLFERFWRADRARTFRGAAENGGTSGTGLGLAIVKHIVEAHRGSVRAESELNHGARFTVILPQPPPN